MKQKSTAFTSICLLFALVTYAAACAAAPGDPHRAVEITYIANAGVMIEHAGKKVVIDAHHYKGNPLYQPAPWNVLEKMVNGMKPFDRVDLILATHMHADHFDAASVGEHLFYSKDAKFVASDQMTVLLDKEYKSFDKIRAQVKTINPGWKFSNEIDIDGIRVKVLGMKHGSAKFASLQNMGYVIKIGKYTFLHIGDADGSEENFESFHLNLEGIDFAFMPYWFLTYKPFNKIVDEYILTGRIIAVHIPPEELDQVRKKILATYPNAIIFSKPMEKVSF
ncbi:MBL fold metallo-hydrolase [candidate division KSB1 bacterium]|nr:MBL fold metallo-hydrolase [candidate division KSB1 bacterium]